MYKRISTNFRRRPNASQFAALFLGAMLIASGADPVYAQSIEFDSTRINVAGDKFSGTVQTAVTFRLPARARLRASHLELAAGTLHSSDDTRAFISLGPVWHWPVYRRGAFLEFGFSPTLLGGSTFNGRDLGGNFHFTSSATFGTHIGVDNRTTVALRVQHLSNGGLHRSNPGMDSVGINFSYDFAR